MSRRTVIARVCMGSFVVVSSAILVLLVMDRLFG